MRLVQVDGLDPIPLEPSEDLIFTEHQLSAAGASEVGDLIEPGPDFALRQREEWAAQPVEIADASHSTASSKTSFTGRPNT
jgi:hypothetical protein